MLIVSRLSPGAQVITATFQMGNGDLVLSDFDSLLIRYKGRTESLQCCGLCRPLPRKLVLCYLTQENLESVSQKMHCDRDKNHAEGWRDASVAKGILLMQKIQARTHIT